MPVRSLAYAVATVLGPAVVFAVVLGPAQPASATPVMSSAYVIAFMVASCLMTTHGECHAEIAASPRR